MGKFQVGDEVVPNEGADSAYSTTNSRHMVKGVVTDTREGRLNDIQVKITEGNRTGQAHWVESQHFDLATPISADQAFEFFLTGKYTEEQYSAVLRRGRA